jgi:hypothetical protein
MKPYFRFMIQGEDFRGHCYKAVDNEGRKKGSCEAGKKTE